MNATPSVAPDAMPRRAVATWSRAWWMLLALLPGAAWEAWSSGIWFAAPIAGSVLWAIALDLPRGKSASWRRLNPKPLLMTMIALLCLPPMQPWWLFACAAILAWMATRIFDDRHGSVPFHPAMIGCAAALVLFGREADPDATTVPMAWIAALHATAGIGLMIASCIRPQAFFGIILGMAAVFLPTLILGDVARASVSIRPLLPALVLTAFFICTDPSSGCTSRKARVFFGVGIGLLTGAAAILGRNETQALLGIAGSVLVMNAAAPWLDRICEHPRDGGRSMPMDNS